MKRVTVLTLALLFVLRAAAAWAEVEIKYLPYTITTPDYYYLNKSLTSTGDAIIVEAGNVTIDLRGHTIEGVDTGIGVLIQGNDVEVRNGTVAHFQDGIVSENSGTRVINIRAVDNAGQGIILDADYCIVRDSTVSRNMADGIEVDGCLVLRNVVSYNTSQGIFASRSVVMENEVLFNGVGINASGTVKNNTVSMNGQGLSLDNALVDGNTVVNNGINIYPCATCTFGTNHAP